MRYTLALNIDALTCYNLSACSVHPRLQRLGFTQLGFRSSHRLEAGLKLLPLPEIMSLAAQHMRHLTAPFYLVGTQVLMPQTHGEQM